MYEKILKLPEKISIFFKKKLKKYLLVEIKERSSYFGSVKATVRNVIKPYMTLA